MLYFFFFNDTATTEIYTLSLHDALPIYPFQSHRVRNQSRAHLSIVLQEIRKHRDRKSTRLNSSHSQISYAVFCLKKKTKHATPATTPRRLKLCSNARHSTSESAHS